MPEVTEIEFEGELTLGYFSDSDTPRCARLDGEKIGNLIANTLNFPSEEEFDAMFQRLEQMRQQGVRPAEGEPDVMREAGRYKISIEKVD
jgi:hypothetical protein